MLSIFKKKISCCDLSEELKQLEEQVSALQRSQANLRRDIPAIIRQVMREVLEDRNRRSF
jgi:hypothetical protein